MKKKLSWLLVLGLFILLTACGGGGGNNSTQSGNSAPTAHAGLDKQFALGSGSVTFDASNSSDPDNDTLSYNRTNSLAKRAGSESFLPAG